MQLRIKSACSCLTPGRVYIRHGVNMQLRNREETREFESLFSAAVVEFPSPYREYE